MKVSWAVPSSVAAPSLEVESSPGAASLSGEIISSEAAEAAATARWQAEG